MRSIIFTILLLLFTLVTASAGYYYQYNDSDIADLAYIADDGGTHFDGEVTDGIFTYIVYEDFAVITNADIDAFEDVLNIPEELGDKTVSEIYCNLNPGDNVTEIHIPAGVTCMYGITPNSKLEKIIVDEGNEYYTDIDGVLYSKDKSTLICYPPAKSDKSYETPAETKYILTAIANPYLEKLTLNEGLIYIGENAFCGWSSLSEVTLPDTLKRIGFDAFAGTALISDDSYTYLDGYLIAVNEEKITDSIEIKSDTKGIADGTLVFLAYRDDGAKLISSMEIPDGCFMDMLLAENHNTSDSIGIDTFANVLCGYNGDLDKKFIVPENITALARYSLAYKNGCDTLVIPEGIEYLPDYFIAETTIKEIYLPKSIKAISGYAFSNTETLEKIHYAGSEDDWDNIVFTGKLKYDLWYKTALSIFEGNKDFDCGATLMGELDTRIEYNSSYSEDAKKNTDIYIADGEYDITIDGQKLIRVIPAADFNNNGKTNASDARLLLRYTADLEEDNGRFYQGDLTLDGKITASDARVLLRYCADLVNFASLPDNEVPIGNYKAEDGTIYGFNSYGAFLNGIVKSGNNQSCYINGILQTSIFTYNSIEYRADDNGILLCGMYTDNTDCYLYKDGILTSGEFTDNTGCFYFRDGKMVKDELIGNIYYGSDGRGKVKTLSTDSLDAKLQEILRENGSSYYQIFDYVRKHMSYTATPDYGIEQNAIYAIKNHIGSCYHYAALTYKLYEAAGYEVEFITGKSMTGGSGVHCWVKVKFDDGKWYHVDSEYPVAYGGNYKMTDAQAKNKGYKW